ncbi:MAG: DUF484 family protein [Xanthomonas perforans]|nr:DUF484 family protein [Xanthomonas perforans]
MSDPILAALRERIISAPELVLEDHDVMRALVAATESARGDNVIDMRGIAMEKLESRLDRLEDTHRSVIAAAYENMAGTNQIHRAILQLLDPPSFPALLETLSGDLSDTLRIDHMRLVLEASQEAPSLQGLGDVLRIAPAGFIADHVAGGRSLRDRKVTLRRTDDGSDTIYGDHAPWVRSEALLVLDLGRGRLPGMLAMGSEDAGHFNATHGTDLLGFFTGVVERVMRRWLS